MAESPIDIDYIPSRSTEHPHLSLMQDENHSQLDTENPIPPHPDTLQNVRTRIQKLLKPAGQSPLPAGPEPTPVHIISSTFPHSEELKFHPQVIESYRRLAGLQRLTLRCARLPENKTEKIIIASKPNPEAIVVIDGYKADSENKSSYPGKLDRQIRNSLTQTVARTQVHHLKQSETDPFEEILRKAVITIESTAPLTGLIFGLIPGIAEKSISLLTQRYLGIEISLGQIPSSAIVITAMTLIPEAANLLFQKIGAPNFHPILLHRVGISWLINHLPLPTVSATKKS